MNYQESLNYILSLKNPKTATSIIRIKQIMEQFNNVQNSLNIIHIAGTNGKGSTACMIASALKETGKKIGLFVSPFIIDFRERIQINGSYIPKDRLAEISSEVKLVADNNNINVGHFDFVTAVAFIYFYQEKCDYVVLETGLGGRFDATNVINKPLCSVITKISLDHTDILGNTLQKIAYEKAGIIKEKSNVFSCLQESEVKNVLLTCALKQNSNIAFSDFLDVKNITVGIKNTSFTYKNQNYILHLNGLHQVQNAILAIDVLNFLNIPENCIYNGLNNAYNPARLEVVSTSPLVIIDGAHNPDGVQKLKDYLLKINFKGSIIFGGMKDKNTKEIAKLLQTVSNKIYTVGVFNNPRSLSAQESASLFSNATACANYTEAMQKTKGENLVICGSLYLASDMRPLFTK